MDNLRRNAGMYKRTSFLEKVAPFIDSFFILAMTFFIMYCLTLNLKGN